MESDNLPERVFPTVCDVKKAVLVFLLFIDIGHECRCNKVFVRSNLETTGSSVPVGGSTLLMKMKIAFSGLNLMRFRMTYTN